jgi:hypothetical protein
MSYSRNPDPLRRLHPQATARTASADMWTTLWTWVAAIVSAVVVLGLVFGYSRTDLARSRSGEASTTGSAPLSVPRLDTRAPAPQIPAQ